MRRPVIALSAVLLVAACGGQSTTTSASSGGDGEYPLTVSNCGDDVTFTAAPQNVVLLKSASVPYLQALGVLGDVKAARGSIRPTTTTTPRTPSWPGSRC